MNKQLKKEARELSECNDVMPENLREHQKAVYESCLDMARFATLAERKRCAELVRGDTVHIIVAAIHLNGYICSELGKKVNAKAIDEASEAIATAIEESI